MSRTDLVPLDGVAALHADALRYPGGIAALAREIGRSAGVLHNKFSDADERYAVSDQEADAMALKIRTAVGLTGYIDGKCATHGGLFVPLPEGMAGESDLLTGQLEMMTRFGNLATEFTEARADGLITPDEFASVRVAGLRAVRSVLAFVADLETRVQASAGATGLGPLQVVKP